MTIRTYDSDGILKTTAGEFFSLIDVARGAVTGFSLVNKFGRNPDVDTGTAPEDIWDGGGLWVPPTTARIHDIASSSANDTSAGSGAQTVKVFGLDSSYAEIDEVVTMNGASNVATSNSYTIIYRMYNVAVGATGINEGDITATAQTDATVTAQITADFGQTGMAIYQVPAGKTAYMLRAYFDINKSGGASNAADVRLLTQDTGEGWRSRGFLSVGTDGSSFVDFKAPGASPIGTAQTLIKLQAFNVNANNADVSAGFDLLLEDD